MPARNSLRNTLVLPEIPVSRHESCTCHPAFDILGIGAVLLLPETEGPVEPVTGLPWQVDILPDGTSRVFGITLGRSTLDEAIQALGNDMQLAIIAAPEGVERLLSEAPEVEVYLCAVDRQLNANKFILPGLGDAGDRTFNTE